MLAGIPLRQIERRINGRLETLTVERQEKYRRKNKNDPCKDLN